MTHNGLTMVKSYKTHLTSQKIFPGKEGPSKLRLGWQEWCTFPKLHVPAIKAKIDTGAKTSALHAWQIKPFHKHGQLYVHFILHPLQHNVRVTRHCTERVIDQRIIISSSGQRELRYIIATPILLGKELWEIELSLTNRDTMAFR